MKGEITIENSNKFIYLPIFRLNLNKKKRQKANLNVKI